MKEQPTLRQNILATAVFALLQPIYQLRNCGHFNEEHCDVEFLSTYQQVILPSVNLLTLD